MGHADGHRADTGTGQAADDIGNPRPARAHIHRHAGEGIDQADDIGTRLFGRSRRHPDIGNVRGQLNDQGLARPAANRTDNRRRRQGIRAKHNPALFHIRAGNVHFKGRHPFDIIEARRNFGILVAGIAKKIGDHRRVVLAQKRHFIADKGINPHILQSNRIKHAAHGFGNARRRIPRLGVKGQPLGDNGTQTIQIEIGRKLFTITKGARSGHHRVTQFQTRNFYRQRRLAAPRFGG